MWRISRRTPPSPPYASAPETAKVAAPSTGESLPDAFREKPDPSPRFAPLKHVRRPPVVEGRSDGARYARGRRKWGVDSHSRRSRGGGEGAAGRGENYRRRDYERGPPGPSRKARVDIRRWQWRVRLSPRPGNTYRHHSSGERTAKDR